MDKIHMRGHTDKWCMENCDSRKVEELNNVRKIKLIVKLMITTLASMLFAFY